MLNYECVVKTAKDRLGNILWQAIYVDNKKEEENYTIDLDKALKYYAPQGLWKNVIFTDDEVYSFLEDYFPEIEDFTYLLDCTDIIIGKVVFLLNGKNIVSNTWSEYRPAGDYERWHWEEIDGKYYGAKFNQYMQGHNVTNFTIKGSDEVFIWEDWNYHQSFLYLNFIQHGNGNNLVK